MEKGPPGGLLRRPATRPCLDCCALGQSQGLLPPYGRALGPTEVRENFLAGPSGQSVIVASGVQASFRAGGGATVRDEAGVADPLDLSIANPAAVQWVADSLMVTAPTQTRSSGPPTRVIEAAQDTDELTVEAWITPGGTSEDRPATSVAIAGDAFHRNLTPVWPD